MGFTYTRLVAQPVVRSYRTFSPLPIAGRLFSVALSLSFFKPAGR